MNVAPDVVACVALALAAGADVAPPAELLPAAAVVLDPAVALDPAASVLLELPSVDELATVVELSAGAADELTTTAGRRNFRGRTQGRTRESTHGTAGGSLTARGHFRGRLERSEGLV